MDTTIPDYLGAALRLIQNAKEVPGYRSNEDGSIIGWAHNDDPRAREAAPPSNDVLNDMDARGWLDVTIHGPIRLSEAGKEAARAFKAQEARKASGSAGG